MTVFRSVPRIHIQRQTDGRTCRQTTLCVSLNAVNPRVSYRKCKYLINGDQHLFILFSLKMVFILININHKKESEKFLFT